MNKTKTIIFIALTMTSLEALGQNRFKPFRHFFERELTDSNESLIENEVSTLEAPEKEDWFRFQRFFLRIRPYVTFTVGVAKIAVIPDFEFYWERELPEGWAMYRPDGAAN